MTATEPWLFTGTFTHSLTILLPRSIQSTLCSDNEHASTTKQFSFPLFLTRPMYPHFIHHMHQHIGSHDYSDITLTYPYHTSFPFFVGTFTVFDEFPSCSLSVSFFVLNCHVFYHKYIVQLQYGVTLTM